MGLGLLPTLHCRLQCLDLGYGLRDAATDAPNSVYAESGTLEQLYGMAWVRIAVGDRRIDECKRAVGFAVFRGLDIHKAVAISDVTFGSDHSRFFDVPARCCALGLALLANLWTVCRVPGQFRSGSDGWK